MNLPLFLLLLMFISCGGFSATIAKNKGINVGIWCLGGFIFGPIGLIAAVGMPDKIQRRYMRLITEAKEPAKYSLEDKTSLENRQQTLSEHIDLAEGFEISKNASESEIWGKIIEVLGPERSAEADRSRSNFAKLPIGGRECSITKSDGTIFAIASSREDSQNIAFWKITLLIK